MQSQRLRELKAELHRLRRHFLPRKWSPTGSYPDRILDRARGFRVLAHAEIEYYMEQVLLDKVNSRHTEWSANRKPSYLMLCLIAAGKFRWRDDETVNLKLEPLDLLKIKPNDDSINDLISRAVEQYKEIVKDNHGIKDSNIKSLILPTGILLSELDPVWLNSMKSFGFDRGTVAHTSRRGIAIMNIPDPKSEWDTVKQNLLPGLETLDGLVGAL
jgi:hypothetical protein